MANTTLKHLRSSDTLWSFWERRFWYDGTAMGMTLSEPLASPPQVHSAIASGSLAACYYIVYFFHRLGGFPGPRVAKMSKLWNVVNSLKSTNFRLMEQTHHQYGDFVRTGTVQIFEDVLKSVFMKNHLLILLVLRPKRDIDIQSGSSPCSWRSWHQVRLVWYYATSSLRRHYKE